MIRYSRVFSMLVIAVILTLQYIVPVAPAVMAQEPSKGVQPSKGPAGTEFAFFATGFEDKEKLATGFMLLMGRSIRIMKIIAFVPMRAA